LGRSYDPNTLSTTQPLHNKQIRVLESRAPTKQFQENLSIDSESQNQSNHGLKKKVEVIQSHIFQLEERQKKLESQEANIEDILMKVQQRTEQLPRIY